MSLLLLASNGQDFVYVTAHTNRRKSPKWTGYLSPCCPMVRHFLSCTTFYERRALPPLMDFDESSSSRAGGSDTISRFFYLLFFFLTPTNILMCVCVCVWFGLYFTVSGFIEKRIAERAEKTKNQKWKMKKSVQRECVTGSLSLSRTTTGNTFHTSASGMTRENAAAKQFNPDECWRVEREREKEIWLPSRNWLDDEGG